MSTVTSLSGAVRAVSSLIGSMRVLRPTRFTLLCAVLLLGACAGDPSAPAATGGTSPTVTIPVDTTPTVSSGPVVPASQTLVLLADGDEPVVDVARSLLAAHAPQAGARRDSITPLLATRGFVAPLTVAEAAAIGTDDRVASAEPPQKVTIDDALSHMAPVGVGVFGQHSALLGVATAPPPWALDRMTQRALPLDGAASFSGTGAGVTIYIIDTGIRETHSEYAGRVTDGPDFIVGGTVSGDCNGHGTKVASDAAGATMGSARQAKLVAVRVLDCNGSGSSVTVVQGIDWVIAQVRAHPGPAVINMSLGVNGVCVPVNQAAARATQAGITVVAAAGNSNANACSFSPAGEPSVITVGATDITDTRASFSNWGSCVDLYAPGANVAGADASGDAAFAPWSGTSAASPFVAGVAALYVQQFPTATPAQVASALVTGSTPNVVKGTNATPNKLVYLPSNTPSNGTPPSTFIAPPKALATIVCVRRSCTLDGRTSTDGVAVTQWTWAFGDGTTGTGATIAHKYTSNGPFVARLTVGTARGLTDVRTDSVKVADAPPTVQPSGSCSGWTCTFDATRVSDDGQIVGYGWVFSEGANITGAVNKVTRTFSRAGTYTVTVGVTDDAGQTTRATIQVATTPRPPTASSLVTCSGRTCTFDASASRDDATITNYTWDFLDQTLQTGVRVTKTYTTAGVKQFKMTVRNSNNLTTTMQGQFTLR